MFFFVFYLFTYFGPMIYTILLPFIYKQFQINQISRLVCFSYVKNKLHETRRLIVGSNFRENIIICLFCDIIYFRSLNPKKKIYFLISILIIKYLFHQKKRMKNKFFNKKACPRPLSIYIKEILTQRNNKGYQSFTIG